MYRQYCLDAVQFGNYLAKSVVRVAEDLCAYCQICNQIYMTMDYIIFLACKLVDWNHFVDSSFEQL